MELKAWRDPITRDRHFHLIITEHDFMDAGKSILSRQRELTEFSRPNASIEEQLMGLQIIARYVEEAQTESVR